MNRKLNFLYVCILVILISSCSQQKTENTTYLPYYNTPDFTPIWLEKSEVEGHKIHQIPDFSFINQEAETFSSSALDDNIYVANFFFTTCPSICPIMTENLMEIQATYSSQKNVKIVSFSVMPWIDTAEKLASYATSKKLSKEQWILLTGEKDRIYSLARRGFFAEEEPGFSKDSTEFLHTELALLIDRQQHIRGVYNATQRPDIERMKEDTAILLKE